MKGKKDRGLTLITGGLKLPNPKILKKLLLQKIDKMYSKAMLITTTGKIAKRKMTPGTARGMRGTARMVEVGGTDTRDVARYFTSTTGDLTQAITLMQKCFTETFHD
jgi:hypothetical protein